MEDNTDKTDLAVHDKLNTLIKELDRGGKLLIRRDLELSRANEKLRYLDQAKSEFVSVAAHQLRTPLSGIKWSLNLLLAGDLGTLSDEQRTFLLKCYESNERMIALINDMLSADRVESGKFRFDLKPAQLLDLVDNVLFEILPVARDRHIKISFGTKTEKIPLVLMDAEKLRGAIQNLLENAVRYTLSGGSITVSFSADQGFVTMVVKDSGIGIPISQQGKIFTRFFRATNAIRKETDGSGLGLFITKNIVEKHGGKLWFESEQGKGSTFYFSIPIAL